MTEISTVIEKRSKSVIEKFLEIERGGGGVSRDFKIGHYGRLGRLDRCHVTQKTRDLLPSSFWDGMFSPGFSS